LKKCNSRQFSKTRFTGCGRTLVVEGFGRDNLDPYQGTTLVGL
jgi:hypothetical protein